MSDVPSKIRIPQPYTKKQRKKTDYLDKNGKAIRGLDVLYWTHDRKGETYHYIGQVGKQKGFTDWRVELMYSSDPEIRDVRIRLPIELTIWSQPWEDIESIEIVGSHKKPVDFKLVVDHEMLPLRRDTINDAAEFFKETGQQITDVFKEAVKSSAEHVRKLEKAVKPAIDHPQIRRQSKIVRPSGLLGPDGRRIKTKESS